MLRGLLAAGALAVASGCGAQRSQVPVRPAPQQQGGSVDASPSSLSAGESPSERLQRLSLELPCPDPASVPEPWVAGENEVKLSQRAGELVEVARWEREKVASDSAALASGCPMIRLEWVNEVYPQRAEALVEMALLRLGQLRLKEGRLSRRDELFETRFEQPLPRQQVEQIEEMLVRAESLEPDQARTLNALGVVSAELQNYGRAREYFDTARRMTPALKEASVNAAFLAMETRRFEEAEAIYRWLLLRHPGDLSVSLGLSAALVARLSTESSSEDAESLGSEAERLLRELWEQHPEEFAVLYNLASATALLVRNGPGPGSYIRRPGEVESLYLEFLLETPSTPGLASARVAAACQLLDMRNSIIYCFGSAEFYSQRVAQDAILEKICAGEVVNFSRESWTAAKAKRNKELAAEAARRAAQERAAE